MYTAHAALPVCRPYGKKLAELSKKRPQCKVVSSTHYRRQATSGLIKCRQNNRIVRVQVAAPVLSQSQAVAAAIAGLPVWCVVVMGSFFTVCAHLFVANVIRPLWRRLRGLPPFQYTSAPHGSSDARFAQSDEYSYESAPKNTLYKARGYSDSYRGADQKVEGESVEWVNMCWRKMWRVYQRGLEQWFKSILQPVFDRLVDEKLVPVYLLSMKIEEFTLDHEAPYVSNMIRRQSRKDSDLSSIVDVRYCGGARMLLVLEILVANRFRLKLPVMVTDLDLECNLWVKIRLAPMVPFIGTIKCAFVDKPTIRIQLNPYNTLRLMKIPVIQRFLNKLLTEDLPSVMTLPRRLEINIPPAISAIVEAAVGRDAVNSALYGALLKGAAPPLAQRPERALNAFSFNQRSAGGVQLPDSFRGELQVTIVEARDLPLQGFPWQSNPYCRVALGSQVVETKRDEDTSRKSAYRRPVWNQEFQFLVENPQTQVLEVFVKDSSSTGRVDVARVKVPLHSVFEAGQYSAWTDLESFNSDNIRQPAGQLLLYLQYKEFEDDDDLLPERTYSLTQGNQDITDIKSMADASSKANTAVSALMASIAVTKAAAGRASTKAASAAAATAKSAVGAVSDGVQGVVNNAMMNFSTEDGSDSDGPVMEVGQAGVSSNGLGMGSGGRGAAWSDDEMASAGDGMTVPFSEVTIRGKQLPKFMQPPKSRVIGQNEKGDGGEAGGHAKPQIQQQGQTQQKSSGVEGGGGVQSVPLSSVSSLSSVGGESADGEGSQSQAGEASEQPADVAHVASKDSAAAQKKEEQDAFDRQLLATAQQAFDSRVPISQQVRTAESQEQLALIVAEEVNNLKQQIETIQKQAEEDKRKERRKRRRKRPWSRQIRRRVTKSFRRFATTIQFGNQFVNQKPKQEAPGPYGDLKRTQEPKVVGAQDGEAQQEHSMPLNASKGSWGSVDGVDMDEESTLFSNKVEASLTMNGVRVPLGQSLRDQGGQLLVGGAGYDGGEGGASVTSDDDSDGSYVNTSSSDSDEEGPSVDGSVGSELGVVSASVGAVDSAVASSSASVGSSDVAGAGASDTDSAYARDSATNATPSGVGSSSGAAGSSNSVVASSSDIASSNGGQQGSGAAQQGSNARPVLVNGSQKGYQGSNGAVLADRNGIGTGVDQIADVPNEAAQNGQDRGVQVSGETGDVVVAGAGLQPVQEVVIVQQEVASGTTVGSDIGNGVQEQGVQASIEAATSSAVDVVNKSAPVNGISSSSTYQRAGTGPVRPPTGSSVGTKIDTVSGDITTQSSGGADTGGSSTYPGDAQAVSSAELATSTSSVAPPTKATDTKAKSQKGTSSSSKPWWNIWAKDGATGGGKSKAKGKGKVKAKSGQKSGGQKSKNGAKKAKQSVKSEKDDVVSEAISREVIDPDMNVTMIDIAREVAIIREESDASRPDDEKDDDVSESWLSHLFDPLQDQPIVLLLLILTLIAIVLFIIVDWRLEHLPLSP